MIEDKNKYIANIKDKNQILNARKLLDKIEKVIKSYTVCSTDFLDPYEIRISKSILNRFPEISYKEEGLIKNSERKIILIYPDYMSFEDVKADLCPLSIKGRFENLNHKDFLGAIMSLRIRREKIGDILIHKDETQIIIKNDIKDYLLYNLKTVGKEKVYIEEIRQEDLKLPEEVYEDKKVSLSSLRLDVVMSNSYDLSRNESLEIIKLNKVKVNWQPISKSFFEVKEGDLISVRGYGRSKIISLDGINKKNKFRATVRIYK
jgi:RNA-binding protein YlmH